MIRNRLLFNENPLVILPELATKVGLNESIVLQQINYWLNENEKAKRNFKDGHYWCYNSYKEWQTNFPFWSESTIKRTISKLENCGLIITGNYNKLKIDRTKWYRLNDELLSKVEESPLGQIDLSIVSKWSDEQFKLTSPLPENNTEINNKDYLITSSFNKLPSKQSKYLNTTDFINDFSHIKDSLKRQILVAYYNSFVEVHKTQHFKLTAEEIKEITTKLDEFYRLTDQLNPEEYTQVDLINKYINYFFSNGETHSIHRFFNHSTIMYVFVQLNILNREGFEVDGSIKTDYSDDIA